MPWKESAYSVHAQLLLPFFILKSNYSELEMLRIIQALFTLLLSAFVFALCATDAFVEALWNYGILWVGRDSQGSESNSWIPAQSNAQNHTCVWQYRPNASPALVGLVQCYYNEVKQWWKFDFTMNFSLDFFSLSWYSFERNCQCKS